MTMSLLTYISYLHRYNKISAKQNFTHFEFKIYVYMYVFVCLFVCVFVSCCVFGRRGLLAPSPHPFGPDSGPPEIQVCVCVCLGGGGGGGEGALLTH